MRVGDDCSYGCVVFEGLVGRWIVGLEFRRGIESGV